MPAFLGWQALQEECSPNYTHRLGSLSSLPFPHWELCVGLGRSRTFPQPQRTGKIGSSWLIREINKDKGLILSSNLR